MFRKNVLIDYPDKDNILYFNDDVDMVTVSDFSKLYIEKCRSIINDVNNAEGLINEVIRAYHNSHNFLKVKTEKELSVKLECPSVFIMLNSPGGSVYSGLSLFDIIKSYNTKIDTYLYASGMCMSMGTILMCSVPVEQRMAHPNATFMVHQLSSFAMGRLADMEMDVEEGKRLQVLTWKILKENTKIPEEKLNEVYEKKEDWFMTSKEAMEYGLIGKVCETPIIY